MTEFVMCSWHKQFPHVIEIGSQWATANVRQKATVICEVRGSQTNNGKQQQQKHFLNGVFNQNNLGKQAHER